MVKKGGVGIVEYTEIQKNEPKPYHSGYVIKSHGGSPFPATTRRRYMEMHGFNATYFTEGAKKEVKGHFDLRNVVRVRSISDGKADDQAIELAIVEREKPTKIMCLAFQNHDERAEWLDYICSAVDPDAVEGEIFAPFVDEALTHKFNATCAAQPAYSAWLSHFSKQPSLVGVISKRSPPDSFEQWRAGILGDKAHRKSLGTAPPKDKVAWEGSYHADDAGPQMLEVMSKRSSLHVMATGDASSARTSSRAFVGAPDSVRDSLRSVPSSDALANGGGSPTLPIAASSGAVGGAAPRRKSLRPHMKSGKNALAVLEARGADLEHMHDSAESADKKLDVKRKSLAAAPTAPVPSSGGGAAWKKVAVQQRMKNIKAAMAGAEAAAVSESPVDKFFAALSAAGKTGGAAPAAPARPRPPGAAAAIASESACTAEDDDLGTSVA